MRLGILSDTHDEFARTQMAIQILREAGAESLVHCGDLASPPIVRMLSVLPSWFVFGNNDADVVPSLQSAALEFGPVCLGWGGVIEVGGRRVGITHGHMTLDMRRVVAERPEILLWGHVHYASDLADGQLRRINPGALHRADEFTVALLDLTTNELQFLPVPK